MASGERWRVPDALWERIDPLLPAGKPHRYGGHRPRVDNRRAMDAIFFVALTGCQWNALNATGICSSSSAHRRFQEWTKAGVFERLWALSLEEYDDLKGIDWLWQAMDGAMTKAPLGGGENRPQSDRPRQAGRQAQRAHGGKRRAHRAGDRRGELPGLPVGRGHALEHPGGAAGADA